MKCEICLGSINKTYKTDLEKDLKEHCSFLYAGQKYAEFEIAALKALISDREFLLMEEIDQLKSVLESRCQAIEAWKDADDRWRKSAIAWDKKRHGAIAMLTLLDKILEDSGKHEIGEQRTTLRGTLFLLKDEL